MALFLYSLTFGGFVGFAICLAAVASGPPAIGAVAIRFVGMGMLGMGNGAVFQLVPQQFPDRMGVMTRIVGAASGRLRLSRLRRGDWRTSDVERPTGPLGRMARGFAQSTGD